MGRARNHRKKVRGRSRGSTLPALAAKPCGMMIETSCRLLEQVEATGREWDVVVIEAGLSENEDAPGVRRYYPPATLRAAVDKFDGLKVNAFKFDGRRRAAFDHLPEAARGAAPGGCIRNIIGVLVPGSVKYAQLPGGGEGIVARLAINEAASDIMQILAGSWSQGAPVAGFSIDASGQAKIGSYQGKRVHEISEIHSVESLDLVSQPAAGGRLLRLVASIQNAKGGGNMLRVLDLLRQHRPRWCEGIEVEDIGQAKVGDIVTNILGSAQERALEALAAADPESAEFREMSKDIAKLRGLLEMLAAGEVEAGVEMLSAWIAEYEAMEDEMPSEEMPAEESEAEPVTEAEPTEEESIISGDVAEASEADSGRSEEDVMSEAHEARLAELEAQLAEASARQRVTEALSGSGLPSHAEGRIRQMFDGQNDVTAEQLTTAINEEREYLAGLTESGKVKGCGEKKIEVGAEQRDRLSKAMDAMLSKKAEIDGVPAFTSLHESYRKMTGHSGSRYDVGFAIFQSVARALPGRAGEGDPDYIKKHHQNLRESFGGWSQSLKESILTTTWAEVFGDSVARRLISEYENTSLPDWRQIVSDEVMLPDFRTQHRVRIGGYADIPVVAEGAAYLEIADAADEEVTYAAAKHGSLKSYSLEAAVDDDLSSLQRLPSMLGRAAARTLSKAVFLTHLAANPTMDYDTTALIAAGHANDQTAALSETTLQIAITQMLKQAELTSGERLGLRPRWLIVPPDLADLGYRLVTSDVAFTTDQNATVPSSVRGLYGIGLIVNTWQTDTADWFLMADPADVPTIEVGFVGSRTPELFLQDAATSGAVFTDDVTTFKIRHIFGVENLDHRGVAGSIVP